MATPIPENFAELRLDELCLATGGALVAGAVAGAVDGVRGVTTDSRADVSGRLFVALSGEHFDGHAFVADVARRGARAVLVERDVDVPADVAVIRVRDTLAALGGIARFHRQRWDGTLVAVAGSAGKTTTKGAVSALLEAVHPGAVHSEPGNLNNLVGVPMVLLGMTEQHRSAVVELGTNQLGEVARLAHIAQADVGVVTLIAIEHSEGLGDLDSIEAEEAALFDALEVDAVAIGNADDARVERRLEATHAKTKRRYGARALADYRVVSRALSSLNRSELVIERPQGPALSLTTGLLGEPGALAVAAGVAVAETVNGGPLSPAALQSALDALGAGESGRLVPVELGDGSIVIDDSYNANPASVLSSARTALEIASSRSARLLLVVGEMRELGPLSVSEHREVGRALAELGAARLIAVAGDANHLAEAAGADATFVADADAALRLVLSELRPGDVVLVKASRGVRAERVVEGLIRAKGRAA
ncbi:MAG: UDP-N-acetylmuramoyl-tripeptide--D-alanyl-D-alanine ligase [Myxococcales bacterium]|nr:UDP-N-acetylmuramoyl-tripeptide--D-alanyl-D-alanine ligase [Myxococcales bacterium]